MTERGSFGDVDIRDCQFALDILKAIKALNFPGINILRMSLHLKPDLVEPIPGNLLVDDMHFPTNQTVYVKIEVSVLNHP